jgi:hypothetical protein
LELPKLTLFEPRCDSSLAAKRDALRIARLVADCWECQDIPVDWRWHCPWQMQHQQHALLLSLETDGQRPRYIDDSASESESDAFPACGPDVVDEYSIAVRLLLDRRNLSRLFTRYSQHRQPLVKLATPYTRSPMECRHGCRSVRAVRLVIARRRV